MFETPAIEVPVTGLIGSHRQIVVNAVTSFRERGKTFVLEAYPSGQQLFKKKSLK